jgi:hypothetical protein
MGKSSNRRGKLNPKAGGYGIQALRCGDVTDWTGRVLRKKVFNVLAVGDIVRVMVRDGDSYFAPYFRITAIKDGTYWGEARDDYATLSWLSNFKEGQVNLKEGQVFPFRKASIIEIPISWQSKAQQRKMEPFLTQKGSCFTGIRK